jgi:hypothetical protein
VSSPNEPGYPRDGGGNGSAGPTPEGVSPGNPATRSAPPSGPAHSAGDVPPWQRGPAGRSRQQNAPAEGPPHGEGPRSGNPPGLDDRLNRFIAGGSAPTSAPGAEQGPRGDRTEVVRPDVARPEAGNRPDGAYASELPDLSAPLSRPPQQRKPLDRPAAEPPSKPAAKTTTPGGRAVQVAPASRAHKGPVRASMQIRRVDPWSALKVSLVLSVAMFFVWMIAVAFLYLVLGGMGVWSKLNSNVGDLLTSASGSSGGELVSSGTIFGGAALIGLVNIVLMTAAATVGAFIYNLTTDLVGGVEVTLADRD